MTPKPSLTPQSTTGKKGDVNRSTLTHNQSERSDEWQSFQKSSVASNLNASSPPFSPLDVQETHPPSSQKHWKQTGIRPRKDRANPIIAYFRRRGPSKKTSSPTTPNEESPLLLLRPKLPLSLSRSEEETSSENILANSQSPDPELGTKKDYWKSLKSRIDNGDFLLSGVSSELVQHRARQSEHKHEYEIQKAIDEIRKGMEFNIWHCLLAIFLYLAISVACFNTIFEPEWTILDSCYFAMVTVTTVGYGDEVPTSPASRVFTCLYACTGVAILGIALGVLGSNLVEAQQTMASKAEDLLKFQVLNAFDASPPSETQTTQNHLVQQIHTGSHEHDKDMVRKPSFFRSSLLCLKGFLPLAAFMLGMAYWIGHRAGWTLLEITYFMVVTATTVGYGDFTPKTDEEKMIALLFIPIAVGATGVWLGGVANIIVESRSARYRRNMGMKELTQRDLDIMDRDSDGIVTRAEFLEFMLVAMNKIDQTLVDELRQHFNRLDVDGTGELTKDDLIQVARKKLHSPTHKLRLAMYKERLMEQSRSGSRNSERKWGTRFFGS